MVSSSRGAHVLVWEQPGLEDQRPGSKVGECSNVFTICVKRPSIVASQCDDVTGKVAGTPVRILSYDTDFKARTIC